MENAAGPSNRPPAAGRSPSWAEMGLVAATGGVVCVWPAAFQEGKTFADWAADIKAMRDHIGSGHIGLGTDGGGGLPALIKGYSDVRGIGKLAEALTEAGFTGAEVAAFMGGNLGRVLKKCIG